MSDAFTRRDEAPATRRDQPVQGAEGLAGAESLRNPDSPLRSLFNLPQALARDWTVVAPLPAHGAEAELLLVKRMQDGEQAVAKLYRPGVRPRSEAIDRLAHAGTDHIVRILERGESDGLTYELMEYCRLGSLRNVMGDAAADASWVRLVLIELTEALSALHSEGIIHRDLKPENVLVRSAEPLRLALTDFGISSIAEQTHHFTSTSRTVRYAPPEAMSGILTFKADYWSLGMILLELLTGRHPFAGLSEAVINHQLITRSVDLSGVHDPAWQALLRGLLVRNPERRWSEQELRRWIAGDPSLDLRELAPDDGVFVASVRPYQLGDAACSSLAELAAALVARWDAGAKDLARGFVSAWLRDELHDLNLVRFVMDLMDDQSLSPDARLLRFALRAAPGLPALWQGIPLSDAALARSTVAALRGSQAERDFLASLYDQDVLLMFPASHPDAGRLAALRERWHRRVDICQQAQLRLAVEEQQARKQATASAGFADFDEVVYGVTAQITGAPEAVPHAVLLAQEFAPEELAKVRQRAAAAYLDYCPWFRSAGNPAEVAVEALAALDAMLPRARRFAEEQRVRDSRREEAARSEAAALREEVEVLLRTARAFARQSAGALHVRAGLQGVYETYQRLSARAHAESAVGVQFEPIRRTLQRMGAPFVHIMDALDRLDHVDRLRAIVLRDGWPIALVMIVLPLVARLPALLGLELVIGAGALGWYGYERASAADRIRRHAGRLPLKVEDPSQ